MSPLFIWTCLLVLLVQTDPGATMDVPAQQEHLDSCKVNPTGNAACGQANNLNIYGLPDCCEELICPAVAAKQWDKIFPGLFFTKEELQHLLQENYPMTPEMEQDNPCKKGERVVRDKCCITCLYLHDLEGEVKTVAGKTVNVVNLQDGELKQFIPKARCITNNCSGCLKKRQVNTVLVTDPDEPDVPYFTAVWTANFCVCPD